MTLAAIIVIALVSAIAAQQLRASTQSVTRLADHVRAEAGLTAAEQTAIYLALTEPMTVNGIDVGGQASVLGSGGVAGRMVAANGSPYRYGDGVVRLYGGQSFLNLTSTDPEALSDALAVFGVPESEHDVMYAELLDFQDADDFKRLSGAEAADYDEPGLPPNRPLRDVLEVCAVKSWRGSAVCSDRGRLLLLGRARDTDPVPARLASLPLLTAISGDEERAADAFARYASGAWREFARIGAPQFDVVRDPLAAASVPGPELVIVSHSFDGTDARYTAIELTPGSVQSPFLIRGRYAIAGDYAQRALRIESPSDVTPLPEPSANAFGR